MANDKPLKEHWSSKKEITPEDIEIFRRNRRRGFLMSPDELIKQLDSGRSVEDIFRDGMEGKIGRVIEHEIDEEGRSYPSPSSK